MKRLTDAGSVAGILCLLMFQVNAKVDTFPLLLVRVNSGTWPLVILLSVIPMNYKRTLFFETVASIHFRERGTLRATLQSRR